MQEVFIFFFIIICSTVQCAGNCLYINRLAGLGKLLKKPIKQLEWTVRSKLSFAICSFQGSPRFIKTLLCMEVWLYCKTDFLIVKRVDLVPLLGHKVQT